MTSAKQVEYDRRWTEEHPQATNARRMVSNAIKRGFVIRPKNCEACGRDARIYGHHDDYNEPFKIKWVCGSCHRKIHVKPKRYMKDMNYISVTSAARKKNVSRGSVHQAVAAEKIHSEKVNGVPHILENIAFELWTPGIKKLEDK